MKFCWVTIHVNDMERSLRFYRDVAGLKPDRRFKPNPDMEICFLKDGETQIELIRDASLKEVNFGPDISLGFEIESTADFIRFLEGKSIPVEAGPFQPNPHIRFFYVLDPNGLKIQFVENIE
ncbi:VOC family protein [bacterium]|nr:VOC family protein [candidate division CSSED10-310 bacterium]